MRRVACFKAGRRHAAGILGRANRCGLLGRPTAHRALVLPAMQALQPVFPMRRWRYSNRDTGKAGLGKRGNEPRFTPNSASCRARFRFAAGEPKADGVLPLPKSRLANALFCQEG